MFKPLMFILAFNTNLMTMPKHRIMASCEGVGDKDRNFHLTSK